MKPWTLRRLLRTGIACGLAVMMCIMNPMYTLAASEEEEEEGVYVREVRISTAKTSVEARKWLKNQGYEVQNQNLNAGTGGDAVYLGYKTTNDPDKAITDLAVMNMKGGYSFGEYEEMMKKQEKGVEKMVKVIQISLKEYRANYQKEMPGAQKAHELMNKLVEDDSGKKMGDFLLDDSMSEKDLVKVIMQGNSTATSSIYQGLALACSESEEENWLKRLAETDLNAKLSPEKYDEKAREIYETQWDPFRDMLLAYQKSDLKLDASKTEIEDWKKENGEDEYLNWTQNSLVYGILASYPYGDGTLADFFLKDKKEFKMEKLYPVVKAMTDGQAAISNLVGLSYLVKVAGTGKKDWKEVEEKTEDVMERAEKKENVDIPETVSVYAGVDRSLFDGGVALTSDALRKASSKGDTSWYYGNISEEAEIALYAVAGTFTVIGVSMLIYQAVISHLAYAAAKAAFDSAMVFVEDEIVWSLSEWYSIKILNINSFQSFLANHFGSTFAAHSGTILGVIALGIALIAESIYVAWELYNYYHPDYTEIPRIIVDERKDEQGKTKYLNYYAVTDQTGQYADLNTKNGKQWIALYTTKDKNAGYPITTDLLVQKGKDGKVAEEGYSPVHTFGEEAAYNLNSHSYKDAEAMYMFFVRDEWPEYFEGSAFGRGNMILTVGLGALGGILIGTFLASWAGRRKKRKVSEA